MKKVFALFAALLLMTACQTKDSYVKDFNSFVEKVKVDADEFTEADWEKADKKFDELSTKSYAKFEQELTSEEKAEIVKLQATYTAVKLKSGVKGVFNKGKKLLNDLKESSK